MVACYDKRSTLCNGFRLRPVMLHWTDILYFLSVLLMLYLCIAGSILYHFQSLVSMLFTCYSDVIVSLACLAAIDGFSHTALLSPALCVFMISYCFASLSIRSTSNTCRVSAIIEAELVNWKCHSAYLQLLSGQGWMGDCL